MTADDIAAIADTHGLSEARAKRMCDWGMIDDVGVDGLRFPVTKRRDETFNEFRIRVAAEFPPLRNRDDAAIFREGLQRLDFLLGAEFSDDRFMQGFEILRKAGHVPTKWGLHGLMGGSIQNLEAHLQRVRSAGGIHTNLTAAEVAASRKAGRQVSVKLDFTQLGIQHGISRHQAKQFGIWGMIDPPGMAPSAFPVKKRPGESVEDYGARLIEEYPPLNSREEAEPFRRALCHLKLANKAEVTAERFSQAVRILESEGSTPGLYNLFALIGGSHASIASHLRGIGSLRERRDPIVLKAREELGLYPDQADALVRAGLLDEIKERSPVYGEGWQPGTLAALVTARYASFAPSAVGIELINDYAVVRRALGIATEGAHPPAFLHAVVDMLVKLGQPATMDAVWHLIQGDRDQIHAYLTKRARERQDVPMPKRKVSTDATIAELRAGLPDFLTFAPFTALAENASPLDAPSGRAIAGILQISHPQIFPVATIIAMHGKREPKFRAAVDDAVRALRSLAPRMVGVDITDRGAIAALFTAMRLLEQRGDRFDQRALNWDLRCWWTAVEIFDDYRSQRGLDEGYLADLDSIAPALPAGSQALRQMIQDDLDEFTQKGIKDRIDRLVPIMADLPRFVSSVFDERARFSAFRESVQDKLKSALAAGGAPAELQAAGSHVEVFTDAQGNEIRQHIRYVVRHWRTVTSALWQCRQAREKNHLESIKKALPSRGWRSRLFENNFVVEFVDCLPEEEGGAVSLPTWIELHAKRCYWQPRDCETDEEHEERCAFLAKISLSDSALRSHGASIGDFERYKKAIARRARQHLGMTLIPLEEIYHSQLVGLVNISARLDEPLRTAEITQFNIGEGLTTGTAKDGMPFSIFHAYAKYDKRRRRYILSNVTEDLADQLLEVTSRRFYSGKGVDQSKRPKGTHGKGPAREAFLFSADGRALNADQVSVHSRILLAGVFDFRPHDLKYIWNRLEKHARSSLESRRERQGHVLLKTADDYDLEMPNEEMENDRIAREQRQARREWMNGDTPAPIAATSLFELQRSRAKLEMDLDFDTRWHEGASAERIRTMIRVVDAKIDRLQNGE